MINIDWSNFTPLESFVGGIFIGTAVVLLMLINGRIAGVSGLLAKLFVKEPNNQFYWVALFLIGLMIGPIIYSTYFGEIKSNMVVTSPWLVIAGLLVGLGTTLGNGCTSGHGICGLSRFSIRSLFATFTFVATGMITVYIIGAMGTI